MNQKKVQKNVVSVTSKFQTFKTAINEYIIYYNHLHPSCVMLLCEMYVYNGVHQTYDLHLI